MAKIRVGFSSDFNVRDTKVGFGTTNPAALLDVPDTLKADFNITGVTTLTAYGGFVGQRQYTKEPAKIGVATVSVGTFQQYYETETGFTNLGGVHHGDDQKFNTLSEDLIIDDGKILNITNTDMVGVTTIGEQDPHNHSSYVCAGSLEQVSVTGHFSVPSGGSNDRQSFIEGTVRFNTDLNTLEFFNGNEWRQFTYNQGQSGRGVFAGGSAPAEHTTIDFVTIPTLGNAQSFGDLVTATQRCGACASSTRGLVGGGGFPNETNVIQYITIASQGDSINFGDLLGEGGNNERAETSALSSSTRGVWGGGGQYPDAATNRIDYVEIATIGDSIDFGDLTIIKDTNGAVSNGTRGLFCGGATSSVIDAITISSKGNSIDIGDLTQARSRNAGVSNSVRGVIGGGLTPIFVNTIDFVIIANNGNATDFGDLNNAVRHPGACSSQTRGLWGGGINPSNINTIDYVTIATAGNAQDFGDLTKTTFAPAGLSDSHGGLGGF